MATASTGGQRGGDGQEVGVGAAVPPRGAAVADLATALAEMREQLRRLLLLQEASRTITASLDLDDVLRELARAAAEIASTPGGPRRRAAILHLSGAVATVVAEDDGDGRRHEGLSLDVASIPALAEAVRGGATVVGELPPARRLPPHLRGVASRAALTMGAHVPIRTDDGLFGVLAVASRDRSPFSDEDLAGLESVADLAAVAVTNARRYAHEQDMAARLGALVEANVTLARQSDVDALLATVARTARDLCACEAAAVSLVAPGAGRLDRLVLEGADAGLGTAMRTLAQRVTVLDRVVADERMTARLDDFGRTALGMTRRRGRIRSFLAAPMVFDDRRLGSLWLVNTRDGDAFGEQDEAVLAGLASLAAVAVSHLTTRRELAVKAGTDPLTALPNRRELERLAALPQPRPFAVLAIDVDNLKGVNDSGGHRAGDDLLRSIAPRLRSQLREGDTVARTGGDEFTALLPGTNLAEAAAVGERMRLAMGVGGAAGSRARISVGCAAGAAGGDVRRTWLRADAALYEAKASGGDRVVTSARRRPAAAGRVELSPTYSEAGSPAPPSTLRSAWAAPRSAADS